MRINILCLDKCLRPDVGALCGNRRKTSGEGRVEECIKVGFNR